MTRSSPPPIVGTMRTAIGLLLLFACEEKPTPSPIPPPAEQVAPPAATPPPVAQPAAPPPAEAPPPTVEAKVDPQTKAFAEAMNRALAASARNDAQAAEKEYREALKNKPDDVAALSGLAEALFAQNQHPKAIATIEKAWELAPTNPQVRWTFGIIMLTNKKRTTEALAAWEALAKENPEYAEPMNVPQRLKEIKKYMEGAPHGSAKTKSKEKSPH